MMKSMGHMAVVASDLNRSREFYEQKLGLTCVADFVLDDRGVDKMTHLTHTRLHLVLLRAGNDESHPVLELTHYESPQGGPLPAGFGYNNVGYTHICFWVDDLDAEYERLRKLNVEFTSPPQVLDTGLLGKLKAVFCKDPDGLPIELLQAGV